ncbi:MAG: mannonate dehydratase [Anaerolineales bacterium]
MQLNFRWFGAQDPIPLAYIRQIPRIQGVVSALFDIPAGHDWPLQRLEALRRQINGAGMRFDVVESLPVHEDIKLGRPSRERLVEAYIANIVKLGQVGVKVICYNFMPLFDWFRTELAMPLADGSNTMSYKHADLNSAPDPWKTKMPAYFALEEDPERLKAEYLGLSTEDVWANLAYFLEAVVPAAGEHGIKMAIHPDDPPWSIFGLPRIITDDAALRRLLKLVEHPANGLTFCTGSLGANPAVDLPALIRELGDRIYFAHTRNLKHIGERAFYEASHPEGDLPILEVMKAYRDIGFSGPMRPDHGRMIWGEQGQAGYGLYDRALGAAYLNGLWEALNSEG